MHPSTPSAPPDRAKVNFRTFLLGGGDFESRSGSFSSFSLKATTKKRSSTFLREKKSTPEKILATPMRRAMSVELHSCCSSPCECHVIARCRRTNVLWRFVSLNLGICGCPRSAEQRWCCLGTSATGVQRSEKYCGAAASRHLQWRHKGPPRVTPCRGTDTRIKVFLWLNLERRRA